MKKLALALCASMCFAVPSFAQAPDASPPADAGAPPPDAGAAPADQGAPAAGGGGGGGKMKEMMQTCRSEAKAQGLKGHDLHQAVMDCVVKQKPGMADRMKCRMAGMDKGLKPGDDLKAFVKDCMKKNG